MEKIIINGLKEEIYYEKLPCGLDVYLWSNEKINSFFASLNVNYGSIHTEFKLKGEKNYRKVPNGIAHFLEHVNFNIKGGTAYDLFDKLGSDINAFTTFEYTSYHVSGATNLKDNLNCLLDYVYTPYFKKNLINNEKGIITEEARAGLDNPGAVCFYKELENTLINDKRKNKIVGDLEDIKNMYNKLILENSFYRGLIVGNLDVQEFESFRKFIPFKSEMESLDFTDEIPIIKDDIEIPDNKINESFIYITYTTKKDSYAIINILNSILNSRELCLQIIREKYKISYHAEAYFKYSNNSIIFFGQISKENKEKFIAAVNEIIDIIQDEQKLKKLILDGKEKLKENYFLISERKNILIDNLANYILNSNGDYSYEDLIKNLDFYDEKRIVEYTKSFERQSTFMYRGDK